jgi:hypothetical protein
VFVGLIAFALVMLEVRIEFPDDGKGIRFEFE